MKEARNLVDLEPVLCQEVDTDLTSEQEDALARHLYKTDEEILASLARSREDIKAGRVYDAREHLQSLIKGVKDKYNV